MRMREDVRVRIRVGSFPSFRSFGYSHGAGSGPSAVFSKRSKSVYQADLFEKMALGLTGGHTTTFRAKTVKRRRKHAKTTRRVCQKSQDLFEK